MLFDPPDRHSLLTSVITYLDTAIKPAVPSDEAFRFRVALNLLKILGRELGAEPRTEALRESVRAHLAGAGARVPEGLDPVRSLAEAIERGAVVEDPALLALVAALAEHALDVDQPRYPPRAALGRAPTKEPPT